MDTDQAPASLEARPLLQYPLARVLAVLVLLFIFLLGVNGLGDAFKSLGHGLLDSFFAATENPFMGLMVGILAIVLRVSRLTKRPDFRGCMVVSGTALCMIHDTKMKVTVQRKRIRRPWPDQVNLLLPSRPIRRT